MTVAADPRADHVSAPPRPSLHRRVLAGPDQGWSSLLFLGVMLWVTGVTVDDAQWAGIGPSGSSETAFLPILMLGAGLLGFLATRTRLPVSGAHLLAAILGAGAVLIGAASTISGAASLHTQLLDLNESLSRFAQDVFVSRTRSTETSALLIAIGAIGWTSGYLAAFSVFRRSRALPAVVMVGGILLVEMSVSIEVQYLALVVFSGAALLLFLRLNLTRQQEGWDRRHIGDGRGVTSLFLRGGLTLVTICLAGAVALAATAASAPLSGAWSQLDDVLVGVATDLDRVLGGVNVQRPQANGLFLESQPIVDVWRTSTDLVFVAAPDDGVGYYWRGAAYDEFDGQRWNRRDRRTRDVVAGGELLADSTDGLAYVVPGRKQVTVTILSQGLAGGTLLAPETPLMVDRDTAVRTAGDGGPFAAIDFRDAVRIGDRYTVVSVVPVQDAGDGAVTESEAAASGVRYPPWAKRYTNMVAGTVGPLTVGTAQAIRDGLGRGQRDPYHIALAVQGYLHNPGVFQYNPDLTGVCDPGQGVAECLLAEKVGFCLQYATTMVMLLRELGIPSRYVQGFLPGLPRGDGTWAVDVSAAHAWVEVYFRKIGWIRFDPTPGNFENGQAITELPAGGPIGSPSASEAPDETPSFAEPTDNGEIFPPDGGPDQPSVDPGDVLGGLSGWLLLALVPGGVLLLAMAALAVRARRSPPFGPDLAYRGIASIAARFGYGPRPSQTAYEYTASLSAVVPAMTQELHVVAHAKVELTYARRLPQGPALHALHAAYRRARVGLLRLFFRRPRG